MAAVINFEQQQRFRLPEDGVVWVDRAGERRGAVRNQRQRRRPTPGCIPATALESINGVPIENATDVAKVLVRIGSWSKADYSVSRRAWRSATCIVGEVRWIRAVIYQYLVGLAYLIIGLFVYFRRGSAQRRGIFTCSAWRRSSSSASTTPAN